MKSYKNYNKIIMILVSIIAVAILSSCEIIVNDSCSDDDHARNQNYTASEDFSFDFDATGQDFLSVNGINGYVKVTGTENITVAKIWGVKRVKSDSRSDANEHLKLLQVNISENEDNIFVETDQPKNSNGREYTVNYNVEIPSDWRVSIDNVNGSLEFRNFNGNIVAEVVNGSISLDNVEGSVDANIVNGNLVGDLTLPIEGKCLTGVVNGSIKLDIPKSTSAEFDGHVVNGTISMHGLVLNNLVTSTKRIKGTLSSGEGLINLNTVNGSITVVGF